MTYIGVDIGGSKIRIIRVLFSTRLRPKIVRTIVFKTPKTETEFVSKIKAQILPLRQAQGQNDKKNGIQGIGFGIAGTIRNNVIVTSPNLPFLRNFPITR